MQLRDCEERLPELCCFRVPGPEVPGAIWGLGKCGIGWEGTESLF